MWNSASAPMKPMKFLDLSISVMRVIALCIEDTDLGTFNIEKDLSLLH